MIGETLRIGSVPGLLTLEEAEHIVATIDEHLGARRDEFKVENRARSVHRIDGESVSRAKKVYEPNGRIEFDELPSFIARMLEAATVRRLTDINTIFPSARRSMDWFYVEYSSGQFITPHADYPHNEADPSRPKVAALSVLLAAPAVGGEFYVETFADAAFWKTDGLLRHGLDFHDAEFSSARRTRWRSSAQVGDALCCGTQLIHGTEPVLEGKARKLIGFLGT